MYNYDILLAYLMIKVVYCFHLKTNLVRVFSIFKLVFSGNQYLVVYHFFFFFLDPTCTLYLIAVQAYSL